MGLQELKNFQAVNPHADLEPFLAKSSPYFRKYIERGLASIEANSAGNGGLGLTGNSEVPVLAEANRVPVVTGGDGNTPSAFMRYKDFICKKFVRSLRISTLRFFYTGTPIWRSSPSGIFWPIGESIFLHRLYACAVNL